MIEETKEFVVNVRTIEIARETLFCEGSGREHDKFKEVIAAHVNEGVFDGKFNISKVKPIYHVGGDDFATSSSEVVTPPL